MCARVCVSYRVMLLESSHDECAVLSLSKQWSVVESTVVALVSECKALRQCVQPCSNVWLEGVVTLPPLPLHHR